MPKSNNDRQLPNTTSLEQGRFFTYSLDQVSKYGFNPQIKWRWTFSSHYFFFNFCDVANTIWANHQLCDVNSCRSVYMRLYQILSAFPKHICRADKFIDAKGMEKNYRVLSWNDLRRVCNIVDPSGALRHPDLSLPAPNSCNNLRPSEIIRRALAKEIISGRFYLEMQRQKQMALTLALAQMPSPPEPRPQPLF